MRRIVFDLDGTLIDSAPDLHRAANVVLAERGAAPISPGDVRRFVGEGMPKLVERVAAARGLAFSQPMLSRFRQVYEADPVALTRPYPGVAEALARLAAHGASLAIATNKPEAPARAILARLGWEALFGTVVGGDTLRTRKPDPAPLLAAMAGASAADTLFVGDSEIDAETAAAAGVRFALFTEGYRRSPVAEIARDMAFADFGDLPRLAGAAAARA